LILNPKDRSTAAWLLANETLFFPYEQQPSIDLKRLVQVDMKSSFLTYDEMSYANITKEDREHIVSKMIEMCGSKKDLTDEVFCHALMFFDRFCFRNMETPLASYVYAVVLVLSIFISGMLLKGTYCNLEDIASMIDHAEVDATFIKSMFIKILKAFDLKLFNLSPDLMYYLVTGNKSLTDEQGKRLGDIAIKYPWLHTNVVEVCDEVFIINQVDAKQTESK